MKPTPYQRTSDTLLQSLLQFAPKPTQAQVAAASTEPPRKMGWAAINWAGGIRSTERWAGQ